LLYASFGGGQMTPILYVHGANIDVGAVVQVDGSDVATVAHRGLWQELYDTDPTAMGYPIYHYVSLVALPGARQPGSSLSITVRNVDGVVSAPIPYALATDLASLDRDGDNLLDSWEEGGYDANGDGTTDVDLAGLGAHPLRPDILVEVDVMTGLDHPPFASTQGSPGTFEMAQAMFQAAPVLNPLGQPGINLILDASGTVPHHLTLAFGTILRSPGDTDFFTLKKSYFDNATRDRIFHYAIWADRLPVWETRSGQSDVDFGQGSGDDFVVAFDDFPDGYHSMRSQITTFVHELGHNLGRKHGGHTYDVHKPNYWSAMSYSWQLRSAFSSGWRLSHPTCAQIYWADPLATEPNGAAPATVNAVVDYSHGMGRQIVQQALDEAGGVCGAGIDWNQDGDTVDIGVSFDANHDGYTYGTLSDSSDWRAIDYRGPESNGSQLP
jgi:hypothetical protein